jgi:hypothetical protein
MKPTDSNITITLEKMSSSFSASFDLRTCTIAFIIIMRLSYHSSPSLHNIIRFLVHGGDLQAIIHLSFFTMSRGGGMADASVSKTDEVNTS